MFRDTLTVQVHSVKYTHSTPETSQCCEGMDQHLCFFVSSVTDGVLTAAKQHPSISAG